MIVLQVNQVHKSFGAEEILSGVKLEVQHRDRVALVGRNGAGKSTLLKIIAGEMSHTAATSSCRKILLSATSNSSQSSNPI